MPTAKRPDLLEILFGRRGAGVIRDALYDEQKLYSFGRLQSVPQLAPIADEEIPLGERYVEVTLHAQRLKYGRKVATSYYPAVRCFATVKRAFAEPVEFSRITTPSALEAISKKDLGNVIFGDQPLLGPVAFWGPLELTVALHAVPAEDLAAPYLALLSDISAKVGGGWLTTASTFAEPIKRGIYAITGTGSETLEVGYVAGALAPRPGYYAAIAREKVDVPSCRLENGRLYDGKTGQEIDDPFMVFSVTASTQIPDWWSAVPGLIEAYARSKAARTSQQLEEIQRECMALVSSSDDLTTSDRKRARSHLAAKFEERRADLGEADRERRDAREVIVNARSGSDTPAASLSDEEELVLSSPLEPSMMDAARAELAAIRLHDPVVVGRVEADKASGAAGVRAKQIRRGHVTGEIVAGEATDGAAGVDVDTIGG